jgi:hypothetical protein
VIALVARRDLDAGEHGVGSEPGAQFVEQIRVHVRFGA